MTGALEASKRPEYKEDNLKKCPHQMHNKLIYWEKSPENGQKKVQIVTIQGQ